MALAGSSGLNVMNLQVSLGGDIVGRRCVIIYFLMLAILMILLTSESFAQSGKGQKETFLKALQAKDIPVLDKLLRNGLDINAPIHDGLTPLAEAAYLGDIEVVNFLLGKGASIEGTRGMPNSPIYFAITGKNKMVVARFLDLGISPNYAWSDGGGTLLTAAVDAGQLDIVELLVQRGADVNSSGKGNHSPLYRAIFSDYYQIFKFLLGKGACLSERDKVALSESGWGKSKKDHKYLRLINRATRCKRGK